MRERVSEKVTDGIVIGPNCVRSLEHCPKFCACICTVFWYQLWCVFVWPVVNNSIIHAVKVLVLSVWLSIFYSAGWIPTSPSGNS